VNIPEAKTTTSVPPGLAGMPGAYNLPQVSRSYLPLYLIMMPLTSTGNGGLGACQDVYT
jgi:hypothetical protein